jgi:hypothetical protein
MKKLYWLIGLFVIAISTGCNSDIVTTKRLKKLDNRCIYIAPLESENSQVGKVVRDIIEKEFIRKKIDLCDPNTATIFITGATFLTEKAKAKQGLIGMKSSSSEAIESVSLVAKDSEGQALLSASYDNKKRYSASKLAKKFGSAVANKLK